MDEDALGFSHRFRDLLDDIKTGTVGIEGINGAAAGLAAAVGTAVAVE